METLEIISKLKSGIEIIKKSDTGDRGCQGNIGRQETA